MKPIFSNFHQKFLLVISIGFVVFHIGLPVYAFLPNMKERAIHLAMAIVLIFLGGTHERSRMRWGIDILFAILGMTICLYVFVNYIDIIEQYGSAEGWHQVAMGLILTGIILEMTRRAVRPALPMIALCFLLYTFLGHWIPGQFGHPQYSLETVSSSLLLTTGGIWGQLLGVSANIIAIFVFLGAFIVHSGGGNGFMKISTRLAGKYTGGPAKVATISSGLFGSISGSASANVASTGAFTIPLMKRLGYRPSLAAAVEAVASTGGQVMPPIMGAGAFVMAELVQQPYLKIAGAAAIPAILYFTAVGIGIHFYCMKFGYRGMDPEQIPGWMETAKASGFFLIPFGVMGYWLVRNYTPQYAAFWALMSTLVLAFLDDDWRLDLKNVWPRYRQAILSGARQAAIIAAICACAQIIITTIAFTGIGVKFTTSILSVTGNSLFLALVLTGLTSILLGMEVPTTAAYIVAVVVGAPVLTGLGVAPLAAHMFVFYLSILSAITPPVCGAIFIASGMAEAPWVETAIIGLKLAFAAFLLPFLFVYDNHLLLMGSVSGIILSSVKGSMALLFLSAGAIGYLRQPLGAIQRFVAILGGTLFLTSIGWLNIAGVLTCGTLLIVNRIRRQTIVEIEQHDTGL